MKSIENKALIYDSNCPMCCWYTNKFIQIGALPKNGRISFNELTEINKSFLDEQRSRHEIPLLDTKTGNVVYGLDGLTLILANKFPIFDKILTNTFCKKLVKPLYNFISYNRRIIVPTKAVQNATINCAPDFNFGWRISLIVFCLMLFYAIIYFLNVHLHFYTINLFAVYPFFHVVFIFLISKDDWKTKLWNVLGDFAVTNLSTTLLFMPLFLINYFIPSIPNYYNIILFVLFQSRLITHFVKRIENKKYLS